jgi:hypothetical protein
MLFARLETTEISCSTSMDWLEGDLYGTGRGAVAGDRADGCMTVARREAVVSIAVAGSDRGLFGGTAQSYRGPADVMQEGSKAGRRNERTAWVEDSRRVGVTAASVQGNRLVKQGRE